MPSVVNRVREVKQPRGGYVGPRLFTKTVLGPGKEELLPTSMHAATMGLAVDYLTRLMLGAPREEAFKIPKFGAAALYPVDKSAMDKAEYLLSEVGGLDDMSIVCACKLCGFDVCFRAGRAFYKPVEEINPDLAAVKDIRLMVNRSVKFFEEHGPIKLFGPTFRGGYTPLVEIGDGDFLTEDTIWDMKVSVKPPTCEHTLQLLLYYLLGKHSTMEEYGSIHVLGLLNPRLNIAYTLDVGEIDPRVICEVETVVMGYR